MARPVTTGMNPRPLGPLGAAKATKSSAEALSASISRAWWSQATHTSPAWSGSCMKAYPVDWGLASPQALRIHCHMRSASGLANLVLRAPVKLG
jgi:hypothetical protein